MMGWLKLTNQRPEKGLFGQLLSVRVSVWYLSGVVPGLRANQNSFLYSPTRIFYKHKPWLDIFVLALIKTRSAIEMY